MALNFPSQCAIRAQGLQKVFGKKIAVRNLSLTVNRGEIFGFLGPNGAGKSTSIKMLLGLVRPTGGDAWVLESPCGDVEVRKRIGFLPENFRFYDWMTPAELLEFHGRLSGVPEVRLRTQIPDLIELVGLTPHRDKRLQAYSKGMMQRIGLAQALVHEPDLIFLDEPTSGLDPLGRRLVRDIIRAQRDRGATVFLNSHLLSEIEVTCDRVCFIRDGEVIESHDLHNLRAAATTVRVSAKKLSGEALVGIAQWGMVADRSGDMLTIHVNSAAAVPDLLRHLVRSGADVYEFTPKQMSLEEMFVHAVGEERGV